MKCDILWGSGHRSRSKVGEDTVRISGETQRYRGVQLLLSRRCVSSRFIGSLKCRTSWRRQVRKHSEDNDDSMRKGTRANPSETIIKGASTQWFDRAAGRPGSVRGWDREGEK